MAYTYKPCPVPECEFREIFAKNSIYNTAKVLHTSQWLVQEWVKEFKIVNPRMGSARNTELSVFQKDVLFGSMLGDGCIAKTKETCYYTETHGKDQIGYLLWKKEVLSSIVGKSFRELSDGRALFSTKTNNYLVKLRKQFYDGSGKIKLPKILRLNALILAVWYCDDGYYNAKDDTHFLYTCSFTEQENYRLVRALKMRFGLEFSVQRKRDKKYNKTYYYLYLSQYDNKKFRDIVCPYMVCSCMQYKLP